MVWQEKCHTQCTSKDFPSRRWKLSRKWRMEVSSRSGAAAFRGALTGTM
jgi:hypothetical protein